MEGEKVIYGIYPVLEAIKSEARDISEIIIAYQKKGKDISEIKTLARNKNIKLSLRNKQRIDTLSGTWKHQGVVAIVSAKRFVEIEDLVHISLEKRSDPILLILDGITDPQNLGSIIRSAEALGVEGIILPKNRAVGVTPAVARTSAGALEYMKMARVINISRTIEYLKKKGFWIVGADEKVKTPIYNQNLNGPLGVVMGNEKEGIKKLVKEKCDILISIPMKGRINSLNVSSASAIIIYEILRQRVKIHNKKVDKNI
jgi:23S rRNA (guanosine2251-2'-O)-methyltransferase